LSENSTGYHQRAANIAIGADSSFQRGEGSAKAVCDAANGRIQAGGECGAPSARGATSPAGATLRRSAATTLGRRPPCREQQQDSPRSASHPPTACALFLKHNEARHSRHYDDAAGLDPKQHQHQRPARAHAPAPV